MNHPGGFFIWYVFLCLELALLIENFSFKVFYLYHKDPKKLWQLKELCEIFKKRNTVWEGRNQITAFKWHTLKITHKASTTKMWNLQIIHLHETLKKNYQWMGVFHIETKFKGYLRDRSKAKITLLLEGFLDLLTIVFHLFLAYRYS